MINGHDFYTVITAMVPLYVAMMLGYASVRWWGVFSAVQCSGINRFVAVFAVPLLGFTFIASNNPYKMDGRFILADTASKVVVLILLAGWAKFAKSGSLDWMITLFSVATLPNTLVMGIPLLRAMYGDYYGNLMVQVVVLQSIIWYTLLLFLFEFRAAKLLLMEQFPETAASIVSFKVDADVMSLDGREPLQTQAQIGDDGKIRVFIRRSVSVSQHYELFASPRRSSMTEFYPPAALQSPAAARRSSVMNLDLYGANSSPARASDFYYTGGVVSPRRSNVMNLDLYGAGSPPRRSSSAAAFGHHSSHGLHHQHSLDLYSMGLTSMPSSKAITPRPSNLTGAEIYSLASQTATPTTNPLGFTSTFTEGSSHHGLHHHPPGHHHHLSRLSSASSSFPPPPPPAPVPPPATASPRTSNFNAAELAAISRQSSLCPTPRASNFQANHVDGILSSAAAAAVNGGDGGAVPRKDKDMQLVSADGQSPRAQAEMMNNKLNADAKGMAQYEIPAHSTPPPINVGEDFSFGSRTRLVGSPSKKQNGGVGGTIDEQAENGGSGAAGDAGAAKAFDGGMKGGRPMMPSSFVMVKLILQMVGRKLLRNPNTYASLFGVIWSLIAFRFGIEMPKIISESLRILAQAGLGMAMFSLGLFMALQPKLIACGTSLAVFAMAVRFLTGPAVMAASSIVVGMRGVHLHAAIVQAALPQGIVPFVFSREYDLHPDILSTAVIFGMLVALPTTLLYYVLLGI